MSKKNRVKITWSIDSDLVKRVKHEAIDMDTDASSIVEKAIKKLLNKKSDKMVQAAKKAWETRKGNANK
jgi:predicted transcriptional regulator